MRCTRTRILRRTLDILLYSTVAIGVLASIVGPIPPPYFKVSCDDPSIKMPYHPNTISITMVLAITLGLPFIVMTVLEWAVPPANNGTAPLREGLQRSWRYMGDLFVGGLFMYFINEMTKVSSGEARPSFWSLCSPNVTAEQCRQPYVSLTWRDCTNPFEKSKIRLVDSMKSFPSGHASISVYSSVFMIVYIKQRLWNKCSHLVAPWLMLVWATWTIICCQSRLWDNQHHWWDVLVGGLLGAFGGFVTVKYLANWFVREEVQEKSGVPGDPNYVRQDERTSSFSHTSIKRLISTASETENHIDQRLNDRELSDINDQSIPEDCVFTSVQLQLKRT